MKLLFAVRPFTVWAVWSLLLGANGLGQNLMEAGTTASKVAVPVGLPEPRVAVRLLPKGNFGTQHEVKYLGSYCADGKFRATSRLNRLFPERTASAGSCARPSDGRPLPEVGPSERIVENFEPPRHAVAVLKGHGVIAGARDEILRAVFGRETVLRGPRYITADANGRLIVSDPALLAVHVLDTEAGKSFRIVGGEGRRLQVPSGVAVDADNNIYVADSERGIVLLYGSDGAFLRSIGDLGGGEGLFHHPTSIAIDRTASHLYVLDGPRLLMLDLAGKILNRIGRSRGDTGELSHPKDLVLSENELLILDMDGMRVQIMNLQFKLLQRVSLSEVPMSQDLGLGVDHDGNIYVSFADASVVKVYNREGALLKSFGSTGFKMGEFNFPTGLWIDSTDRIYVADTRNLRVQVFQLSSH